MLQLRRISSSVPRIRGHTTSAFLVIHNACTATRYTSDWLRCEPGSNGRCTRIDRDGWDSSFSPRHLTRARARCVGSRVRDLMLCPLCIPPASDPNTLKAVRVTQIPRRPSRLQIGDCSAMTPAATTPGAAVAAQHHYRHHHQIHMQEPD